MDRAIEQTEALIAKQQRIKTGLMQDLLTRGIDEHGNLRSESTHKFKDSPLGRDSVEWDVSITRFHLGHWALVGGTPSKAKASYWGGVIPLAVSKRHEDLDIAELASSGSHEQEVHMEAGDARRKLVLRYVVRGMILARTHSLCASPSTYVI